VPGELIRAITEHEIETIHEVLKCYTVDQTQAAFRCRLVPHWFRVQPASYWPAKLPSATLWKT
jgi:hypothetical protein